ncbi:MAG: pro-sigmaK processing inhibitor BofA family protein [Chitinophagales bacterium]
MSTGLWVACAAAAVILLGVIVKLGIGKTLGVLIIRTGIGVVLLLLVNLIGNFFSFLLPVNAVSVLTTGFLGIPGILLLGYLKYTVG